MSLLIPRAYDRLMLAFVRADPCELLNWRKAGSKEPLLCHVNTDCAGRDHRKRSLHLGKEVLDERFKPGHGVCGLLQ